MKNKKEIHQRANEHDQIHAELKKRIGRYNPAKENILPIFIATFAVVLTSLLIFKSWNSLSGVFKTSVNTGASQESTLQPPIQLSSTRKGMVSTYRINNQANRQYRNLLASIDSVGSRTAAQANLTLGEGRKVLKNKNAINSSFWITNYLSNGQHLSTLDQSQAKSLQKSILSTYYLGEKTIDQNSIIQSDSKLLSQIKNTLSIDLFQYLNQSVNRSDALDGYLHLLNQINKKANDRINDLDSKIAFLSGNSSSTERQLNISEDQFFQNLTMFDGSNAEEELARFIELQESQAAVKAKLGAYQTLKEYYEFFKPQTENLIKEIQLNRDALIAGVRVTEIQNMRLPLIIQNR